MRRVSGVIWAAGLRALSGRHQSVRRPHPRASMDSLVQGGPHNFYPGHIIIFQIRMLKKKALCASDIYSNRSDDWKPWPIRDAGRLYIFLTAHTHEEKLEDVKGKLTAGANLLNMSTISITS